MRFDLKTDDAIHCPQSLLSPAAVIFTRGLNALVTQFIKNARSQYSGRCSLYGPKCFIAWKSDEQDYTCCGCDYYLNVVVVPSILYSNSLRKSAERFPKYSMSVHTHTHARTHARTQARTQAHTHTHTRTHTHTPHTSRTHTCTHARMHVRTHAQTHTRARTCTHAGTRAHAHTHTHTHTHTEPYLINIDRTTKGIQPIDETICIFFSSSAFSGLVSF